MALSALLDLPLDPQGFAMFSFEHAMAHRALFNGVPNEVMAGFSVAPYLLDPMPGLASPADSWSVNHQQAHDDTLAALPSFYGVGTIGGPSKSLVDTDLNDEQQRLWWTFSNHIEHMNAAQTIQPPTELYFPRW